MTNGRITILGSINMDVVFRCQHLPAAGETLICTEVRKYPGGKGLNQAIASVRAGAVVNFNAAIGNDAYGQELKQFLESEGVNTAHVVTVSGELTGLAHILVDNAGQNMIAVSSGANRAATAVLLEDDVLPSVALCQLETPLVNVERFLRHWNGRGVCTILNVAPASAAALRLLPYCNYVVLNEVELLTMSSLKEMPDNIDALCNFCRDLAEKWQTTLVLTMGSQGVIYAAADECRFLPTEEVVAKDTTGAGDCFCGFFASSLSRGRSPTIAINSAMKASAISVTRNGAASSIPKLREVVGR